MKECRIPGVGYVYIRVRKKERGGGRRGGGLPGILVIGKYIGPVNEAHRCGLFYLQTGFHVYVARTGTRVELEKQTLAVV